MKISKAEALSILKVPHVAEVPDAYEELLFEWKKKYLLVIPPIAIIRAHLKKIERLNSAASLFIEINEPEPIVIDEISLALNLIDYLKAYQPIIMQLKLKISTSDNGKGLIFLLKQVIKIEEQILFKLSNYSIVNSDETLKDVKISKASEFYQVEKELMEKEISETEIKNYLRTELKFGTFPFDSFLLNEVLKAVKQLGK